MFMTPSSSLFQKIESRIRLGKLDEAKHLLLQIGSLKKLNEKDVLSYFRLMRRVGEFDKASLQIEKLGIIYPSLKLERAFFLGECGAIGQALELLSDHSLQHHLTNEDELQRQMQLGNFYSLLHQYDKATVAYQSFERESLKNANNYLALVGRLNALGHMIYASNDLPGSVLGLQYLIEGELKPYPLLKQGAYYFISLAKKQLGDYQSAISSINKAYELGVTHRLRESLLLDLTAFELEPHSKNASGISRLKKRVLSQAHIVYYDQFNKIMAIRSIKENNLNTAKKYLNKILFGKRITNHYRDAFRLYQTHFEEECQLIAGDKHYWEVEQYFPRLITQRQLTVNKIYYEQLPLLQTKKLKWSLSEESPLLARLSEVLMRNLEFPLRDAELWESVWQKHYNFITSPALIRSTISRWRKTKLKNFADLKAQERRIKLELKNGVRFLT